ncbi:MAG: hypothetical protein ACTHJW_11040 [Streptosporangiaceae bacterium]
MINRAVALRGRFAGCALAGPAWWYAAGLVAPSALWIQARSPLVSISDPIRTQPVVPSPPRQATGASDESVVQISPLGPSYAPAAFCQNSASPDGSMMRKAFSTFGPGAS